MTVVDVVTPSQGIKSGHGDASIGVLGSRRAEKSQAERPFAAEIFCGHAGISARLQQEGFDVLAVDWKSNQHHPRVPVCIKDLSVEHNVSFVVKELDVRQAMFVWLAPPSNSFSRARETPLPERLRQGREAPRSLRDGLHPLGLADLRDHERAAVAHGNALAKVAATIAQFTANKGKSFAIENPRGSWIWEHSAIKEIAGRHGVRVVDFQACMYGGQRDKRVRLMANVACEDVLGKQCDKKHNHAPWSLMKLKRWKSGVNEEAEYPDKFCQTVASLVAKMAISYGFSLVASPAPPRKMGTLMMKARAVEKAATVGRQTWKFPHKLVPEYKAEFLLSDPPDIVKNALRLDWIKGKSSIEGVVKEPDTIRVLSTPEERGADARATSPKERKVAEAWTEPKFLKAALEAKHPADYPPKVPVLDAVGEACFRMITSTAKETKARLAAIIDHWK